jgi:uncharacterized membrane protein YedE/YeeE
VGQQIGSQAAGRRGLALFVFVLLAAVPAYQLAVQRPGLAIMWIFGLAFGVILQRSRFCFASAFRDLYLLQDGRMMKGIIIGMVVATLGFSLVMGKLVPDLAAGSYPARAGVYPLGYQTLVAGILFGLGMVVAGGCATGTLYRIGEGYITSFITLLGMLGGMYLLAQTWSWWWSAVISVGPKIWLPHSLGWGGAMIVVLGVLLGCYLLVQWFEARSGLSDLGSSAPPAPAVAASPLERLWRPVFGLAWPTALAGLLLGVLNVFEYLYQQPWGVTTEMSLWAGWIARGLGLPAEGLLYYGGRPAGYELLRHPAWQSGGTFLDVGIISGSFLAALLANEFKFRAPRTPVRYAQALVGGLLMGYGARLGQGCNIGSFFSAIPALGVNGWLFALGLAVGSYAGVKVIRRLA